MTIQINRCSLIIKKNFDKMADSTTQLSIAGYVLYGGCGKSKIKN